VGLGAEGSGISEAAAIILTGEARSLEAGVGCGSGSCCWRWQAGRLAARHRNGAKRHAACRPENNGPRYAMACGEFVEVGSLPRKNSSPHMLAAAFYHLIELGLTNSRLRQYSLFAIKGAPRVGQHIGQFSVTSSSDLLSTFRPVVSCFRFRKLGAGTAFSRLLLGWAYPRLMR
jgi:hypothetical protein